MTTEPSSRRPGPADDDPGKMLIECPFCGMGMTIRDLAKSVSVPLWQLGEPGVVLVAEAGQCPCGAWAVPYLPDVIA